MDSPYNLITTISPEKGKRIDEFDKHSKFIVKISAPTDLNNIECKERLFLPMCHLYRNCVELSLKTICFEEIGEDF